METTVNLENDRFFLNLVKQGKLRVTRSGRVFNTKTKRELGTSKKPKYAQIGWRATKSSKVYHIQVHRLIYIVYGSEELGNRIVNHIDGNKRNNHIDNLEPSDYFHNMQHAVSMGLKKISKKQIELVRIRLTGKYGDKNLNSRLSNRQANSIRVKYTKGNITQQQLARNYRVSRSTIRDITNGYTYRDAKFSFKLNKAA